MQSPPAQPPSGLLHAMAFAAMSARFSGKAWGDLFSTEAVLECLAFSASDGLMRGSLLVTQRVCAQCNKHLPVITRTMDVWYQVSRAKSKVRACVVYAGRGKGKGKEGGGIPIHQHHMYLPACRNAT